MFVYVGGESVYSSSKTLHSKVSPRGRRRGRGGGEKVRQKTKIASAIIRTEQAGGGVESWSAAGKRRAEAGVRDAPGRSVSQR